MSSALLRNIGIWLLLLAVPAVTQAQFSVLYTYGTHAGDPIDPNSSTAIAQGRDGNLYSTGQNGGANGTNAGAVFKITPAGTLTVLYSFCSLSSCADGKVPYGGLTLGTDGNFYGTTTGGGNGDNAYGDGVVYQVTPAGTLTVLHAFDNPNKGEGYFPWGPPVEGPDGNFYGTTSGGGSANCGTIYKVSPTGSAFTVLHTFSNQSDVCSPRAPLVLGTDGNLYGTSPSGAFTEFKVTTSGKYTHLSPGGIGSWGPLNQGANGLYYGAGSTQIYKTSTSGSQTVLHASSGSQDPNGSGYNSGMVWASDGNLYGSSQSGGTSTNCSSNLGLCGVIFKMTPGGAYTDLHDFENPDGYEGTPVIQHTNGIIYGQANFGGTIPPNAGTFWSFNNSLKPFIKLLPATGKVGDQIGILGQGFSPSSVVKFNGVTATAITVTGSTFITATVPGGTLDGYVTVTTSGTTLMSLVKFLVHDSWGTGAPLPTPVRYPAGVGAIGSKIYVVGGITTGGTFIATNQVYNTLTNTWTTAAPLPTALADGTGAVVNGTLYVIGGSNTPTSVVDTVYAYNPSTNTWTSKATMPTARASIGSAIKSGVIYVMGGVNGDGVTRLSTNESYNPGTNTWTTEAPMLTGKSEVSVGLAGSTILATDGYTTSGDTGDNEGYNASTNFWKPLKPDPTPRHDSCYGVILGLMYIAGGGLSPVNTNESYNLTSNSWTTLSPIPVATTAPGSVVANGQLFCFGGGDSTAPTGGNFYNNVQIYQP